jgi:hypothetical protein
LLRLLTLTAIAGAVFLCCAASLSAAGGRPLVTAVTDDLVYSTADASLGFARTRKAGASLVRLIVRWDVVAPPGSEKPPGFDPADPGDPAYDWAALDREVRLAVAHGLQPIVGFYDAPSWAQDQSPHPSSYSGFPAGPYKPSPVEAGRFAHAMALRYGGSYRGLPRVRYWRMWNEPNLIGYLSPQFANGKPFAARWYRLMLNAFAQAVHGVHSDNVVVAGSLAPFSFKKAAMAPLQFMRSLLCMSGGRHPKPVCPQSASLDAFAVHPYTSGGPTHHASNPNDISLGDLSEAESLLAAAARYHRIRSRIPVHFWVTEFSWDTRPPDPNPLATPLDLQARWTAEALYRMWKSGVSLVTWFLLRDEPWPQSQSQSGLYFRSGIRMALDQPKPTLTAFRFPFVAYRQRDGTFVWGRTPGGRPGRAIVEQRLARSWKRLSTIRSDRYGIFTAVLRRAIPKPKLPTPSVVRTGYSAAVLADFPTSYWRLGEKAGKTVRDLTGRHPASATGGVKFGVPGALRNDANTAVEFNGSDGKIDLGTLTAPSTVELWVKTKTTQDSPLFSNRNALHQFVYLGTFQHLPHVFDSFHLFGGSGIANNRWHQIVYTYSGVTGKVYVDGRLDATNTWIRDEGGADASLGFDASIGKHFKGSIDEVAVYDHTLTDGLVRKHFLAAGRKLVLDPDLGSLRARLIGSSDASLPFLLKPPPDRYVLPFGG